MCVVPPFPPADIGHDHCERTERVYDPRDGKHKQSTNPALILRDMLCRFGMEGEIDDRRIRSMANFCDELGWAMSYKIKTGVKR